MARGVPINARAKPHAGGLWRAARRPSWRCAPLPGSLHCPASRTAAQLATSPPRAACSPLKQGAAMHETVARLDTRPLGALVAVLVREAGQCRRLGPYARHSPPACGFARDTVARHRSPAATSLQRHVCPGCGAHKGPGACGARPRGPAWLRERSAGMRIEPRDRFMLSGPLFERIADSRARQRGASWAAVHEGVRRRVSGRGAPAPRRTPCRAPQPGHAWRCREVVEHHFAKESSPR